MPESETVERERYVVGSGLGLLAPSDLAELAARVAAEAGQAIAAELKPVDLTGGSQVVLRVTVGEPSLSLSDLQRRAEALSVALSREVPGAVAVVDGLSGDGQVKCYSSVSQPLVCVPSRAINVPNPAPCLDWMHRQLRVDEAWWDTELPVGGRRHGAGVVIGQLDTGWSGHPQIDPGRVDLHNARGFNPGDPNGIDNLQITRTNSEPGHGSNCASITLSGFDASADPATSVVGVAPEAILLPVRMCNSTAAFHHSYLAAGVDHVVAKGAHVVTMSVGQLLPSPSLHDSVHRAIAANRLVVAAAGQCVAGMVVVPASIRGVVPVGGLLRTGARWGPSSYGGRCFYASAYGCRVAAVAAGPTYLINHGSGTSYAAAGVAGVAALWLAHFGRDALIARLTAGDTLQAAFMRALTRTADPLPNIPGPGCVNAFKLLSEANPVAGPPSPPLPPFDWRDYAIDLLPDADHARLAELLAPLAALGFAGQRGARLYALIADVRLSLNDYSWAAFAQRFLASLVAAPL